MSAFVLDNSVTMRWLFRDGSDADRRYADSVLDIASRDNLAVYAPSLWPLEVANVLVRATKRGVISIENATELLDLVQSYSVIIDTAADHDGMRHVFGLAQKHGLSAYDASYLALALRRGIPLATLDNDLRRAAVQAGVVILGEPGTPGS